MDKQCPFGGRSLDCLTEQQADAEAVIRYVDPVVLHGARPCEKLNGMGLHRGQPGYDQGAFDAAVSMVDFIVRMAKAHLKAGTAASAESPKASDV